MYLLGVADDVPADARAAVRDVLAAADTTAVVTRHGERLTAELVGSDWSWTVPQSASDELLSMLAPRCRYCSLPALEAWSVPVLEGADEGLGGELLPEPTPVADLDGAELLAALEETEPYETLESLVARIKRSDRAPYAGAIATFTGRVRELEDEDDVPTDHLTFERYDPVAAERLATIREELMDRDGVEDVLLHHRTGRVDAGEDIVFVVVLAGHREEAFAAVEDGIDRLKADVPIFKKEVTVDNEYWVHNRP